MTAAHAAPPKPKRQPEQDAYLAACSALLLAIATNTTLTDHEADVLLDAMPTAGLRNSLHVGLAELGALGSVRTLR